MDFEYLANLAETAHIVPYRETYNLKKFHNRIDEYNEFLLKNAKKLNDECTTRTHLLINNCNADIIGYISLATASISLTKKERDDHQINARFGTIPTLKIGKLAVDERYEGNGYGSLLIYLTRGKAEALLDLGIACKFIDVDVDVEHDKDTLYFYKKNGFLVNGHKDYQERTRTVSMRLEHLYNDKQSIEKTGT